MNPESFKEQAEQKLYVVRDVEGEPNREELKIIREVEEKLSEHPAFIGLAPFGSIVSGTSVESSDIDLYVLCDSLKVKDEKDYFNFTKMLKDICIEKSERNKIKIQAILEIVNIKGIAKDIERYFDKNIEVFPETQLAEISRIVTGKKIDEYREKIAENLQKLPLNQQREVVEKITESLARRDNLNLSKRKERVPKLSEQEHKEILEKRKEMWRKRVQKIWGIKED